MTPDRPSDPPVRSIRLADGAPVSYTDEGSGPVLVALHGLPGSARDYRWLGSALPSARLVRIEQPGFGGTPLSAGPGYTLWARTRFVLRVLEALGLERCVVLGHSMGGPLAISVAASVPDRVVGLALLASVGLRPHRAALRFGRYPDLSRLLGFSLARRIMLPGLRAGMQRAGFPRSTTDEAILQTTRIFHALSFEPIRAAVRRIEVPSFLGWAEDDALVEPAIELELGAALPAGPRISFPDGGHNLQKTRAVELGEALTAWVSAL